MDPDIEKMEVIREILTHLREPMNQKQVISRTLEELGIKEKELRRLLKKGIGTYWNMEKGERNASLYRAIDSACQFGSTIYTRQTEKQDSAPSKDLTNKPISGTPWTRPSTEFGSLSQGSGQTGKQEGS